jgi:hypothetical protein
MLLRATLWISAGTLGATGIIDWNIVGPICFSIIVGGFGMAWRLGGLERSVKDLIRRMDQLETDIDEDRRVDRERRRRRGTD